MAYEAPGIIVRSENEAHVGTADRGASALHLANTISFAVPQEALSTRSRPMRTAGPS